MTRVIAVLTERDLVVKSPHPTDRRQVLLTVTDEGRAVVHRVRRRKDAWLDQRLAELTAAERATLRAAVPILEKLSQSLPARSWRLRAWWRGPSRPGRGGRVSAQGPGSVSRSRARSGQLASETYRGWSVAPSRLRTR